MTKYFKKISSLFISIKFMIFFIVVFAISIAVATFIENEHGTETAWALVYNAVWFEFVQVLLGINLLGNILKFKLFKLKKLPVFFFHISFLIILIGSGLTRYMGYEGLIHIREAKSQNKVLTTDSFVQITAKKGDLNAYAEKKVLISSIGGNSFHQKLQIDGKTLHVRYKNFMKNAEETVVQDEKGTPIIMFGVVAPTGLDEYYLKEGKAVDIGPFGVIFKESVPKELTTPYIQVYLKNGRFYFYSNIDIIRLKTASNQRKIFQAKKEHEYNPKMTYIVDGIELVSKKTFTKGIKKVVSVDKELKQTNNTQALSALFVELEFEGNKIEEALMGFGQGSRGVTKIVTIEDMEISLEWGSKVIEQPFFIYLKDFVAQKYPGTINPSVYESKVIIYDEKNAVRMPYTISTNNALDYGGFRFFQSSYDEDEKGTILRVNYDPGKWPTYIGYIFLGIGLFLNLFNSNGRLGKLFKARYMIKGSNLSAFIVIAYMSMFSQNLYSAQNYKHEDYSSKNNYIIDKKHAEHFGTILVQGADGRIKPIDTVAIRILNKVYGSTSISGLNHNQILLGMLSKPSHWKSVKMIQINHQKIKKLLGIKSEQTHVSFFDMYDKNSEHLLKKIVKKAVLKSPVERDVFDKEVIAVEERLKVLLMVYSAEFMKVFPLEGDPNKAWYHPAMVSKKFPSNHIRDINIILMKNFMGINKAYSSGDWRDADISVNEIKAYQQKFAANIMPSQSKVKAEIIYNQLNVFNNLIPVYLFCGFVILLLIFVRLTRSTFSLSKPVKIATGVLMVALTVHTFALLLRWYIAEHAPWSNAYETMLYVSWTIILAVVLFMRKSEFAISFAAIFAGITLFVAHLSWLNPQITTMIPILKSNWLMIHVSVITASYGFLGLSALLGFMTLIFYIIIGIVKKNDTQNQIALNIKEATRINEISMIIGLSFLVVGNFLGGVWANESWGRYWGWDSKEAWSLVTILVYVAILHLKFIPKIWNEFNLSVLSVAAYSSVIMTFFGVNYFLSGLHSFGGEKIVQFPIWIYYAIVFIVLIFYLAFKNRDKYKIVQDNVVSWR
jgi:cytochrome c-type biogenesis protein CcsB